MEKITTQEINNSHVQSVRGDTLIGNADDNKAVFDKLPELIARKYNSLVDELESANGTANINTPYGSLKSVITAVVDTLATSSEQGLIGLDGTSLLDRVYPVGSIYMSMNRENPSSFLGGTWVAIPGRFLVGVGSNGASGDQALSIGANTTGGYSAAQLPSHTHTHNTSSYYALVAPNGGTFGRTAVWSAGASPRTSVSGLLQSSVTIIRDSISLNAAGVTPAGRNLPPYFAVYIWRRTN